MTTTIALITTGKCEQRALADSLQRVFAEADVEFTRPVKIVNSVTSDQRLSYPTPRGAGPTYFDTFFEEAIVATLDQRRPPDYVFVVDDLEPPNVDAPETVTRLIVDAAKRSLGQTPTISRLERIRTRCSIHLLSPMVESYFFGESAALLRAGAQRVAVLDPNRHLERFLSIDAGFLEFPDKSQHQWRKPSRERHPKQYMLYLSDPDDTGLDKYRYRETRGGCLALEKLDWHQVFSHQPQGIAFARSLFDDLANALGVQNPFPGKCHPLTQHRSNGVLRNLS